MKALASLSASAKSCTALSQAEGSLRRLSPSACSAIRATGQAPTARAEPLRVCAAILQSRSDDGRFERSKRDRRLGDEQVEYLQLEGLIAEREATQMHEVECWLGSSCSSRLLQAVDFGSGFHDWTWRAPRGTRFEHRFPG